MPSAFRCLAAFALLAVAVPALAQAPEEPTEKRPERYAEVRLPLPSPGAEARPAAALAERLAARGVHLDHARIEETALGPALRTVLSASELARVRAAGIDAEVIVADLAAEVAARTPMTEAERAAALAEGGIAGNVFGSMGGYPTFSEALAILDDMHAQYPHLISPRVSIGQSHEGREIWMVEVSDQPGVDEGEPEVLLTALHHAREPGSLTTVLYTLWYLLEQYETNREVRHLVDERRLFVVPVLNPDGYVYNETTNPNGGGMWRKNRRNNGGSFGVDLNRNYGYQWGYNDSGSSPNGWSETYRGPGPFSEPEVAALRDFLQDGRAVRTTFNYHTYGDLLLYAWAYDYLLTPDDATFVAYAQQMTAVNGYTYGSSPYVLYPSNGNANDWLYGEQATKPKVFSFTPEVGPSFWPPEAQIVPLAEENLRANLLLMHLAGSAPVASVGTSEDQIRERVTLEVPVPNPVVGTATLAYTLSAAGPVRVSVYDLLGREVAVLEDGERAAGRHALTLEAAQLPRGTYVVRLQAGGVTEARRVTVAR